MPFQLRESSSDLILETEAPTLGGALVEVARGFTHITTAASNVAGHESKPLDVRVEGGAPQLLVAFVDELIFLFGTTGFLPMGGSLQVELGNGASLVRGTLIGETFDPTKHKLGTEVKAATFHGARLEPTPTGARAHVLVDL